MRNPSLYISLFVAGLLAASCSSMSRGVEVTRSDGAVVPMRVYAPEESPCAGMALVSHGAGGTEEGLDYLAEALREAGWLAVVVGHRESGPEALRRLVRAEGIRDGLLVLTTDSVAQAARLRDLDAARRWAEPRCAPREPSAEEAPFVVLIGYSMGAATAMIEAGAANRLGLAGREAFDAYVAISPAGVGSVFPEDAWQSIDSPVYVLTGTRDQALEGDWTTRLQPYESLRPGCKWLGVIRGATHLNFAGRGFARRTKRLTTNTILAFLDALARGDCGSPPGLGGIDLRAK